MGRKNKRKSCCVTAIMVLFLVFLYFKGADLYYLVNYKCTETEYYRAGYQERWGVDMPVSKVVFHKSKDVGWDGGGAAYTVFRAEKESVVGETWMENGGDAECTELEERTKNIIEEIVNQEKGVPIPNFEKRYYWFYKERAVTGTGANGIQSTILVYIPEVNEIYCIEGMF